MKNYKNKLYILILLSFLLFTILSTLSNDFYNTNNIRGFIDGITKGNPYDVKNITKTIHYQSFSWRLDWSYPPLTIGVILPAWLFFNYIQHNENIYQFIFKLPLYISSVCIAYYIFKETKSLKSFGLYLFNLGVILTTYIWGGFDILAALLLIIIRRYWKEKKYILSMFLLSLAISLRLYPVVILPFLLILNYKNKKSLLNVFYYLLISLFLPIVSILIFYLWEPVGFKMSFLSQQQNYGPFGIFPLLTFILLPLGISSTILVRCLLMLLFISVTFLLWYAWKHRVSVSSSIVLSLLIFFLFYPKVHALYIMVLLPFYFLEKKWYLLKYIWLPGFIWAITVNGYAIRGISYWFYWLTKSYIFLVNPNLYIPLTLLLTLGQELIILLLLVNYFYENKVNKIMNKILSA